MKIAFVASVYRHLVVFHMPYMRYFKQKGFTVIAIAANDDGARSELESEGIQCWEVPFNRKPLSKMNVLAYIFLKRIFKEHRFSLIHVHTPVAAFITRLANRKKKYPLIYTAHGFHFYQGAPFINWLLYYPLEYIGSKWTDKLITLNQEDYERALNMNFKSVKYIKGIGVEDKYDYKSNDLYLLKKELKIPKDSLVISYIAELNRNKNQIYILRNWEKIKVMHPEAYLLLIGDGEDREKINNYIYKNKLRDILVLGYRKDVDRLLEITDIVTLLSYREGLPKSIMEAMMNGKPCIVTDTRGLRDLIDSEKEGFVIPLDFDESLINSFDQLLSNEELRIKMGGRAKIKIQPYLLDNVYKEYAKLYNEFLDKNERS